MAQVDTKQSIKTGIEAFDKGSLTDNALALFKTLGYNVERQQPFKQKTFAYFKEYYLNGDDHFREEKALVSDWTYLDLLFQLSKEEISQQHSLFDTRQVDRTIIETYLFFTIELKEKSYSRTLLSQITRELNRVFPMPVMVLFKHGNTLTLSIINRRLHKRDEQKDVLEKVTLIKDISVDKPHRAHIEILFDLSFDELLRVHKFSNFVELHNAWQRTLDTKELNKRFYQELSNWYFWAMDQVSFPDDVEKDRDIRNSTNLIRLITRIIFIWFIKEKGLVPEMLFDRRALRSIVKDFSRDETSSNYYKAILQNLFFGTLNQAMDERGFAKQGSFVENRSNYGVKNLFRYADLLTVSETEALRLFTNIPFLNGGLFDCLDRENDEGKVVYVDGFSRNPKKQAIVPDFLFFGVEEDYDLNEVYGTRNKRYKVQGLIELLSHYKFTIAENTPIEEEVALDPELLGKVFENLLASYNPETKTTARKQTGSFYTPREIVNYMVDESIKTYLKGELVNNTMSEDDAQTGLDLLFEYTEDDHPFNDAETRLLIDAIDKCKILDPACGSGAFPMGVLHKLVHILHKLDSKNEQWKQKQIDKVDKLLENAEEIPDSVMRGQVIASLEHNKQDIEDAFESNELDYGRKLYLIENCIYGVDIQPIAVQIAKLRFFISLIIDQKKQPGKENLGIRSLPNLETKFLAANTLVGLDKPKQMAIKNPEIDRLEANLKELRHKYFSARTRREKFDCQKKDKAIRQKITGLLITDGWGSATAQQIVQFDPYDQNASAPFFDPEWMFGLADRFDVVIGNPPYMIIQTLTEAVPELIKYYKGNYESATGKFDLYCLFTEKGISLLNASGILNYIMPSKWTVSGFGVGLRKIVSRNKRLSKLISFESYQVFNASTYSSLIWLKGTSTEYALIVKLNKDLTDSTELSEWLRNITPTDYVAVRNDSLKDSPWTISDEGANHIVQKLKKYETINRYIEGVFQGIVTGDNDVYWLYDCKEENGLISGLSKALCERVTIEKPLVFPFLYGKTIGRFRCKFNSTYIIYPYKKIEGKTELISQSELQHNFPLTYKYFLESKYRLTNRGSATMHYPSWYSLWNQRSYERLQKKDKILTPDVCQKGSMWKDKQGIYFHADTSYAIIMHEKFKNHTDTIYGILNSSILWFYLQNTGVVQRGGFFRFKTSYLKPFPVPDLNQDNTFAFTPIVSYVSLLSDLDANEAQRSYFDRLIDAIVYEIYFPEEIKAAGAEVMKYLNSLPGLRDEWNDEKNLETIKKVYMDLTKSDHPLSIAMEKMKTVPEVRVIEGLDNE